MQAEDLYSRRHGVLRYPDSLKKRFGTTSLGAACPCELELDRPERAAMKKYQDGLEKYFWKHRAALTREKKNCKKRAKWEPATYKKT